jgi:hypothetical protein
MVGCLCPMWQPSTRFALARLTHERQTRSPTVPPVIANAPAFSTFMCPRPFWLLRCTHAL